MALHPSEERARTSLNLVINIRGLKDTQAAETVGKSRQWLEARLKGDTKIKLADIALFAERFDVPETLWTGEPADLLQWFADRAREVGAQEGHKSTCNNASASILADAA